MAPKKKKRTTRAKKKVEREPQYMVQVSDPRSVRRELLQTLREVLLFMQSYEKFHEVQKEKVAHIRSLREITKELNVLVGTKLKKHLPKGKLLKAQKKKSVVEQQVVAPAPVLPSQMQPVAAPSAPAPNKELDELEQQLQAIEDQLQTLQ